jgi:membrane protein DedA with SNARE-associated domain
MLGTLGLIPILFVEVYFGYLANHVTTVAGNVSEHSTLHTIVTVVGFVVCIVLMIYIARVASRAIAEAELDSAQARP